MAKYTKNVRKVALGLSGKISEITLIFSDLLKIGAYYLGLGWAVS
jgi:hypothetical protein